MKCAMKSKKKIHRLRKNAVKQVKGFVIFSLLKNSIFFVFANCFPLEIGKVKIMIVIYIKLFISIVALWKYSCLIESLAQIFIQYVYSWICFNPVNDNELSFAQNVLPSKKLILLQLYPPKSNCSLIFCIERFSSFS